MFLKGETLDIRWTGFLTFDLSGKEFYDAYTELRDLQEPIV